jgi:hypothetical protein
MKAERSALRHGRRSPGHMMLRTLKIQPIIGPTGEVIGEVCSVEADPQRIYSSFRWIVRGLYYFHTQSVLDPSYEFRLYAFEGPENKEQFDVLWPDGGSNGPFRAGGCVVYKFCLIQEVPEYSKWLLAFFGKVLIVMEVARDLVLKKIADTVDDETSGSGTDSH